MQIAGFNRWRTTIAATAAASARQAPQADPRPANNPEQKPAFAGQTDAPEQKLGVAFDVVTVVEGLQNPWSVAFLPDGKMLITERPGRLRVLGTDGKLSEPVAGLPAVFARSQGGLLDVVLDRPLPGRIITGGRDALQSETRGPTQRCGPEVSRATP